MLCWGCLASCHGTLCPVLALVCAGDLVWKFATSGPVWSSPAIDSAGDVYIGSFDYNVYCIDGSTGTQVWAYATQGPVQSSPAIGANGVLYIGSQDNNVYALHGSSH